MEINIALLCQITGLVLFFVVALTELLTGNYYEEAEDFLLLNLKKNLSRRVARIAFVLGTAALVASMFFSEGDIESEIILRIVAAIVEAVVVRTLSFFVTLIVLSMLLWIWHVIKGFFNWLFIE